MTPSVRRSFEDLERNKAFVLSRISNWRGQHLAFHPRPASWSALDVLDHLVRVEEAAMQAVLSNLPNPQTIPLRHRFSGIMVRAVMRSPIRVRVPDSEPAVLPGLGRDLQSIKNRWAEVRHEMTGLLAPLSPEQLRAGVVRHPVAGWMTILQGMDFLSAHLRHHVYQLDRLGKSVRAAF
jgi:hypothetical protein